MNSWITDGLPIAMLPRLLLLGAGKLGVGAIETFEELSRLASMAESFEHGQERASWHVRCIGEMARELAARAGMGTQYCLTIERAAMLHDIGKLLVAPSGSSGWFEADPALKRMAGQHALRGSEFLSEMTGRTCEDARTLAMARDIALFHHEAWNGSGYPRGVEREAIPFSARIVDFFDTHSESEDLGGAKAVAALIAAAAGYYFDPELVSHFLGGQHEFQALCAT